MAKALATESGLNFLAGENVLPYSICDLLSKSVLCLYLSSRLLLSWSISCTVECLWYHYFFSPRAVRGPELLSKWLGESEKAIQVRTSISHTHGLTHAHTETQIHNMYAYTHIDRYAHTHTNTNSLLSLSLKHTHAYAYLHAFLDNRHYSSVQEQLLHLWYSSMK